MTDALKIDALKNYFKDWSQFTVADIQAFYQRQGEEIKRSTLDWRIYDLKEQGIIQRVGWGIYSLEPKTPFTPNIDSKLKHLYNKLKKQFPYLTLCVWNTKWLNELMVHQPFHFYTLIEIEKDGVESVFYFIREKTSKTKRVFLDPTGSLLEKYGVQSEELIIVKPLISEAPLQNLKNITIPALEKILVDLYCEEVFFAAQQGAELEKIFINAFERYRIDEPKMLRYAGRRKKRQAIKQILEKIKETALFSNNAKS